MMRIVLLFFVCHFASGIIAQIGMGYWRFETIFEGRKIVTEKWAVPGKRAITIRDGSTTEKFIVDFTARQELTLTERDGERTFEYLRLCCNEPPITDTACISCPTQELVEGIDFVLLPETKVVGGIKLLHAKLLAYDDYRLWLIEQTVTCDDYPYDSWYNLKDGRRLTALEFEYSYSRAGQQYTNTSTLVDYRPSVDVADGFFSMSPPAGYTMREFNYDATGE